MQEFSALIGPVGGGVYKLFIQLLPLLFLFFIMGLIIRIIVILDYKWFGRIPLSTQDPWMLKPRMQIIREKLKRKK